MVYTIDKPDGIIPYNPHNHPSTTVFLNGPMNKPTIRGVPSVPEGDTDRCCNVSSQRRAMDESREDLGENDLMWWKTRRNHAIFPIFHVFSHFWWFIQTICGEFGMVYDCFKYMNWKFLISIGSLVYWRTYYSTTRGVHIEYMDLQWCKHGK